jgi:CheY-like chemotaxis protein
MKNIKERREENARMATTNSAKSLLKASDRHHLMLLYENERDRSTAEIASINHALQDGCYCVYATVDADENDFLTKLAPLVKNYDRHISEGNLRIVNFKPYYEFALKADRSLFDQLKIEVEEALRKRAKEGKRPKALLVADAACNMSKHKQFEECVSLETWWQNTYHEWKKNNLDITIICAHPLSALSHENLSQKSRIAAQHSITMNLDDLSSSPSPEPVSKPAKNTALPLHFLVVEPEPDIRGIYKLYLKSLPVELETVENGMDCFAKTIMGSDTQTYDLIMIDTHIRDTTAIHVAKKILEENPNQNIVFSTTWNITDFKSELRSQSLDPEQFPIVRKPFSFSQLLGLIKPGRRIK